MPWFCFIPKLKRIGETGGVVARVGRKPEFHLFNWPSISELTSSIANISFARNTCSLPALNRKAGRRRSQPSATPAGPGSHAPTGPSNDVPRVPANPQSALARPLIGVYGNELGRHDILPDMIPDERFFREIGTFREKTVFTAVLIVVKGSCTTPG